MCEKLLKEPRTVLLWSVQAAAAPGYSISRGGKRMSGTEHEDLHSSCHSLLLEGIRGLYFLFK